MDVYYSLDIWTFICDMIEMNHWTDPHLITSVGDRDTDVPSKKRSISYGIQSKSLRSIAYAIAQITMRSNIISTVASDGDWNILEPPLCVDTGNVLH